MIEVTRGNLAAATFALGRFGSAAEFNGLGWGSLVNPQTSLGLRPTFRIRLGVNGHNGGFWASPYPALSTYNQSGFDWLNAFPDIGSVVYARDAEPVNIICSVPYLISAPVTLSPVYPNNLPRAEWVAAGFDADRQALEWRLPDGRRISIIVALTGTGFRFINQGAGATLGTSLPRAEASFTEGLPIDAVDDFIQVRHQFACLPLEEQFLPAGRYHFRFELAVIPRSFAYRASNQIPVVDWFRNVNLGRLTNYPTASMEIIGDMPAAFPLPKILSMAPLQGRVGAPVEFTGTLLGRTQEVSFSPDAHAGFTVISDNLVRANVPVIAETGGVVLETARGFVATRDSFEVLESPQSVRSSGVKVE